MCFSLVPGEAKLKNNFVLNTQPFKHPLVTVSKPTKEEIQKSKENQRRRNLSQYDDLAFQYSDINSNKTLRLKFPVNFKNMQNIINQKKVNLF